MTRFKYDKTMRDKVHETLGAYWGYDHENWPDRWWDGNLRLEACFGAENEIEFTVGRIRDDRYDLDDLTTYANYAALIRDLEQLLRNAGFVEVEA